MTVNDTSPLSGSILILYAVQSGAVKLDDSYELMDNPTYLYHPPFGGSGN